MNILGIETSSRQYSLALFTEDGKALCRTFQLKQLMTSSLIPKIKELLKTKDLNIQDIDGFAVGLGPGGFTSLRVGLSMVKGLVFSLQKPVVGVSSLDLIAESITEQNKQVCVIVDARRNMVYSALYQRSHQGISMIGEYRLEAISDVLDRVKTATIFTGDAIACYKQDILDSKSSEHITLADEKHWSPKAIHLLTPALKKFQNKEYESIITLKPLYLYPDDCQVMKK